MRIVTVLAVKIMTRCMLNQAPNHQLKLILPLVIVRRAIVRRGIAIVIMPGRCVRSCAIVWSVRIRYWLPLSLRGRQRRGRVRRCTGRMRGC